MTKTTPLKNIELTDNEKRSMLSKAKELGFHSLNQYFKCLHNNNCKSSNRKLLKREISYEKWPKVYYKNKKGKIYHGDSLALLHEVLPEKSIDLIVTSPPFGLTRQKAYGNRTEAGYLDWFRDFAVGFRRVLKSKGSLVIDIGGAWKKGEPTRSLYHFELLLMLCKEYEFHLAQEHYWWNPSKLPSPAEWVNVKRCRVKDAVNCIWWLSKTPLPKANNRKVLSPYSDSMEKLFKNGYSKTLRPSGHKISDKFGRNNGGSVPPNLIALANTESNSSYLNYCKQKGYVVHPARFPSGLPEYFIQMLTNKNDIVLDPFAGSCVTGEIAERLKRKWICCEIQKEYLKGAKGRFKFEEALKKRIKPYQIHPPCTLADD